MDSKEAEEAEARAFREARNVLFRTFLEEVVIALSETSLTSSEKNKALRAIGTAAGKMAVGFAATEESWWEPISSAIAERACRLDPE